MRSITTLTLVLLSTVLTFGGCSSKETKSRGALLTETDSVAYVIGMNIARNLREMDSTLNIEAVAAGLCDHFRQSERFAYEEARRIYLHYQHVSKPEAVLAYETRFLEEIVRDNRSYARSKSGLTYTVLEVGDEEFSPRSSSDTVVILYRARTLDGREFDSSYERGDTTRTALGDLPEGVREALKLIGKGGEINAYLPAALGFGAEGNPELGVEPNSTLYYEIKLLDAERRSRNQATRRNQTIEF